MMSRLPQRPELEQRGLAMRSSVLLKALSEVDTDDCVLWPRSTDSSGYPTVWMAGRCYGGHRLVVQWATSSTLVRDDEVMHSCDTPACVNPRHLSVRTHALNIRDMNNKGRAVNLRGSAHGRAKFTESEVRLIKQRHRDGEEVKDIARSIGSPYQRVWMICTGKNWRHIT